MEMLNRLRMIGHLSCCRFVKIGENRNKCDCFKIFLTTDSAQCNTINTLGNLTERSNDNITYTYIKVCSRYKVCCWLAHTPMLHQSFQLHKKLGSWTIQTLPFFPFLLAGVRAGTKWTALNSWILSQHYDHMSSQQHSRPYFLNVHIWNPTWR